MDSHFTFDDFIVGKSNECAYNAMINMTQNKLRICNFIYIYGPSGTGKTHLLKAAEKKLQSGSPELRVIYLTSRELTDVLVYAIQTNQLDSLRNYYQNVDYLFVDDLQNITGMESTAEVFEDIFTRILSMDGKIVIAADRLPKEILSINNRLRRRLMSAAVINVSEPGIKSREEIARRKAAAQGKELSDDICRYIAEITDNAFQIEGAVRTLLLRSAMTKEPLDLEKAVIIMEDAMIGKQYDPDVIIKAICVVYDIELTELTGNAKIRGVGDARRAAAYLLRKHSPMNVFEISSKLNREFNVVYQWIQETAKVMRKERSGLADNIRLIEATLNSENK